MSVRLPCERACAHRDGLDRACHSVGLPRIVAFGCNRGDCAALVGARARRGERRLRLSFLATPSSASQRPCSVTVDTP